MRGRAAAASLGMPPRPSTSALDCAQADPEFIEGSRGAALRRGGLRCYLRGRTASFSCFAMRALTTVFAGILIASPVAGFRPIRALRF